MGTKYLLMGGIRKAPEGAFEKSCCVPTQHIVRFSNIFIIAVLFKHHFYY